MNQIINYIMDPVNGPVNENKYNRGVGYSKDEVLVYFINNIKGSCDVKTELSQFIDAVYNLWNNKFTGAEPVIPFRFSSRGVKLARAYDKHCRNELNKILTKIGPNCKLTSKTITIGKVQIDFGNGSLFNNRAAAGLGFESLVKKNIASLVYFIVENGYKNQKMPQYEFNAMAIPQIKHLYTIYESGDFDLLIEKAFDGEQIEKYIKLTGGSAIHRNKNGQLWGDQYKTNTNDLENVLIESGKIIADVTFPSKDGDKYISCKLDAAQLSGVGCSKGLNNNDFVSSLKNDVEFKDVDRTADGIVTTENFCRVFGLDMETMYNAYLALERGTNVTKTDIPVNDDYDEKELGCIIRKIIGGNYWYVTPTKSLWVPAVSKAPGFKIGRILSSGSGKTITIHGLLGNSDMRLVLRTDGSKYDYPHRLFPKFVTSDAFVKAVAEK